MVGAPEPTVTVNGKPAQVSDRYYLASDVPLSVGENTLTVVATDYLGNARTQEIKVSRIAVGSDRLTMLSGNNQRGAIITECQNRYWSSPLMQPVIPLSIYRSHLMSCVAREQSAQRKASHDVEWGNANA